MNNQPVDNRTTRSKVLPPTTARSKALTPQTARSKALTPTSVPSKGSAKEPKKGGKQKKLLKPRKAHRATGQDATATTADTPTGTQEIETQETETQETEMPMTEVEPTQEQLSARSAIIDAGSTQAPPSARSTTIVLHADPPTHHRSSTRTARRGEFNYVRFIDAHYEHMGKSAAGGTVHRVEYSVNDLTSLCDDAIDSFKSQTTLIDVNVPVNICGDVHGQFGDLVRMLATVGTPPKQRYLFLGDYVDRGQQSLECVCLLIAYKVFYPHHVYLLRGNHEQGRVNKVFGFYDEIVMRFGRRHGKKIWIHFQRVFDLMPVVGLVEGRIFCMHGGLSPKLNRMDDVRNISKPISNPRDGMLNDFMWADPSLDLSSGWADNDRGTSFVFAEDVVADFCHRFDLDMVVRAHQVCLGGYWFFANKKMVTMFSAPAYCNAYNNAGAAMHVSEKMVCSFKIFQPLTTGYDMCLSIKNA